MAALNPLECRIYVEWYVLYIAGRGTLEPRAHQYQDIIAVGYLDRCD